MITAEELQKVAVFKSVETPDLEALIKLMRRQTFTDKTVLFRRGDPGDSMYIILSGQVRIYIEDSQENQISFRIYKYGDIFGEFSILDQQPRSASASTIGETELLVLYRDNFLTFLRERPIVGLAMMRSLAERIRYTTLYLEKLIEWTDWLTKGEYEQALQNISVEQADDNIQNMIATFVQMVQQVKQREETLKRHLENN